MFNASLHRKSRSYARTFQVLTSTYELCGPNGSLTEWHQGRRNPKSSRTNLTNWHLNLNGWFTKAFHYERQTGQDVTIPKCTRWESNKDSIPMQYPCIQYDICTNNNIQWTNNVVHLLSVSDSLLSLPFTNQFNPFPKIQNAVSDRNNIPFKGLVNKSAIL